MNYTVEEAYKLIETRIKQGMFSKFRRLYETNKINFDTIKDKASEEAIVSLTKFVNGYYARTKVVTKYMFVKSVNDDTITYEPCNADNAKPDGSGWLKIGKQFIYSPVPPVKSIDNNIIAQCVARGKLRALSLARSGSGQFLHKLVGIQDKLAGNDAKNINIALGSEIFCD